MRSTPVAAAHVQADTRRHYALIRWREKSLLCPAATPSATMRCSCHAVASPECRHERTGRRIPFRPRVFEAVRRIAKGMVSGSGTVPNQPRSVSGSVCQLMQ